jgi:pyruvate/2-oxoglutarate/acetoin dehydrogenase E1 component
MVAAGVGAALNGMRPVVDLNVIDFALGAMDEIVNQAAKIRYMWRVPMPLVIRGTGGIGLYGPQHNNSLEAWFAQTPGLLVAAPSTPADTKGLIKTALRGEDPVIFLMDKSLTGARAEVGGPDDLVQFGKAALRRSMSPAKPVSQATVAGCAASTTSQPALAAISSARSCRSLIGREPTGQLTAPPRLAQPARAGFRP